MHLSVAGWAHETPIHADWTKTDPERVRPITLSGRQWNEVPIADQAKQDPFHSMPRELLPVATVRAGLPWE